MKRVLLVLFSLIAVLIVALIIYGFYLKPKYEGELQLKNIQKETTVYFDEFGVPHIYADSQKDAMEVLGYVHAQDRLWQMELMRRIASGRLSAIFGSVALKSDTFFVGLGIEEASQKAIEALDKNSSCYQLAIAYLEGVNQYLDKGVTPVEFQLLGIKKEKFTLKDVYNVFGYMAFSFASAQRTDPLLTDIRNKYGMDYLKDFDLNGNLKGLMIKNAIAQPQEFNAIAKTVASLMKQSPIPPFIGSNSWVIAPQKTKKGKVIFANDPHIGYSQPGTWFEAHLVTPDFESYGYYLAGTPFPLLSHNREYASGITMFENDDVDLYQEANNPQDVTKYKTPDGYKNYEIRKEVIKVKDSSDVVLTVKVSRHGPIMNDLIAGLDKNKPVALSWIYTQQPIMLLQAVYQLSHAKSKADFEKGVALIAAPGLNIMYGDAKGNVAWWATGKLYKHAAGVNTNFILDGASGKEDITEYLDFSKNPKAINPAWHYVYSANNQPEAVDGYLYPGYYLPENRAKRITQLLDSKNDWDKEAVSKMITDNTSSKSSSVVLNLLVNIDPKSLSQKEIEAITVLKSWNGTNNLKDVGPTIYNRWIYFYLKNTFEDELGKDNFGLFMDMNSAEQVIATQIANDNSPWWDNIATKNIKETRNQILSQSFKQAVTALETQLGNAITDWTWDKVHTLEHGHPMGKVAALRSFFNVGPFASAGSNEVINNLMFAYSENGEYKVNAGPSTRRVIDFSDIENSWSILPTGQSGNPLSSHYRDQAVLYNAGKFRKMKLNKKEIVRTATKLVFKPR